MVKPRYGNTYRRVWRSWWMWQRYKRGHRYVRECDWCGDPEGQSWYPWKNPPMKFANGRTYGRWSCRWYGQCEAAPG